LIILQRLSALSHTVEYSVARARQDVRADVNRLLRLTTAYSTFYVCKKGKGSPYSITERTVPELIPVLGSQPACDVNQRPGGSLPLLSARPTVPTSASLKRAATNFAAW